MLTESLEYKGNADFEKFLIEEELPLSVWPIRSYLIGLLLAPEAIAPSWILDEILLKDTEDEVVFKDMKQYEEFMSKFMSLWNHLSEIRQGIGQFYLAPVPEVIMENEADFALTLRSDEINSFLGALNEGESLDLEGLSSNFNDYIDDLEDSLDILESLIEDPTKTLIDTKKALNDSQEVWAKAFPAIREELLQFAKKN